MITEYKLGINIKDLEDNVPIPVAAGGKDLALVKVGGKMHALDGLCSHKQGPLGKGRVENGNLICPWHRGAFSTESGKASEKTPWVTDINVYKVRVDSTNGDIFVEF